MQKLVDAGTYKETNHLYESSGIMGSIPEIGSYKTMGGLWIEHVGPAKPESVGYRRGLNVVTGLVTVTQPFADGSVITEETISSAVNDCIAIRLSSSVADGLNFDVSLHTQSQKSARSSRASTNCCSRGRRSM